MNKKKKEIIALLGLVLIMLVAWLVVLRKPSSSITTREAGGKDGLVSQDNIDEVVDKLMSEMKIKQALLNSKSVRSEKLSFSSLRNPFQKPLNKDKEVKKPGRQRTKKVSLPRIVVKGIMWDKQNPAAIINDEVVYEGSFISGYKIIKIEPDGVIVNYNGKRHILNVPEE